MTMILADSYSDSDRSSISSAYSNLDDVAAAIESHDESVASVEDLLSYYIENTGGLPAFMTGTMLDPSDPDLDALWSDSEFVDTIQDWRSSNTGQEDMTTLVSQLEAFLQAGSDDGYSACDFSVTDDATDLINEWYEAHPDDGVEDGVDNDASGILMTEMMSIAMMMGNPGLAILFYIMGSETEIDTSTLSQNEDGSWNYTDEYGGIHTLGADNITDNGNGTYTIETENGPVTVNAGEVVNFSTTGLGEVVMDFQSAALDTFNDLQEEIDSLTDELGSVDYEDPASTAEVEALKAQIDRAKNIADVYSNLIEMVQDILDSLVETASSLIDRQTRTLGAIASRI